MFKPAHGDLMGIATSDNNMIVEWSGKGRILFSYAQRGNAISAHFASNKQGLLHIKTAINEFCDWCFNYYGWCEAILAFVKTESVVRLIKKCGFEKLTDYKDVKIYLRAR